MARSTRILIFAVACSTAFLYGPFAHGQKHSPLQALRFTSENTALFIAHLGNDDVVFEFNIPTESWQRLYVNKGRFQEIALSRDGRQLAFVRVADQSKLYHYAFGEAQPTLVVDESRGFLTPQFSPDGLRVVYASKRGRQTTQIMEVVIASDVRRALTAPDAMYATPFYVGDTVVCAKLSEWMHNSPIASNSWHRMELIRLDGHASEPIETIRHTTDVHIELYEGDPPLGIIPRFEEYSVFRFTDVSKPERYTLNLDSLTVDCIAPAGNLKQLLVARGDRGNPEQTVKAVDLETGKLSVLFNLSKTYGEWERAGFGSDVRLIANEEAAHIICTALVSFSGDRRPTALLYNASTQEVTWIPLPMELETKQ